jgi:hypothetical protein
VQVQLTNGTRVGPRLRTQTLPWGAVGRRAAAAHGHGPGRFPSTFSADVVRPVDGASSRAQPRARQLGAFSRLVGKQQYGRASRDAWELLTYSRAIQAVLAISHRQVRSILAVEGP